MFAHSLLVAGRRYGRSNYLASLAVATAFVSAVAASPVSGAEVLAVQGEVYAAGPAGERPLKQGSHVGVGDSVSVGEAGIVQVAFSPTTRMAAGYGASFSVGKLDLAPGPGKAPSLELGVLDGAFRFISDEIGDKSFSIRTPVATISLSGTAFDYTSATAAGTRLLLYNGRTTMCGVKSGGECRTAATPCAMLRSTDGRRVERVDELPAPKPDDVTEAAGGGSLTFAQELSESFPFPGLQSALLADFRIDSVRCDEGRPGGIAEFAIEGSRIRVPQSVALGAAGAAIICIILCDSGSTTSTNKTN